MEEGSPNKEFYERIQIPEGRTDGWMNVVGWTGRWTLRLVTKRRIPQFVISDSRLHS